MSSEWTHISEAGDWFGELVVEVKGVRLWDHRELKYKPATLSRARSYARKHGDKIAVYVRKVYGEPAND